jgi:hypothetical protein
MKTGQNISNRTFIFSNSAQSLWFSNKCISIRVSSKQTKINFGSNRNKPKQDLFRVCFGLFRETKNKTFRYVSVFRTYIETTETNRSVSHQTETTLNFLKNTKIYSLLNCLVVSSVSKQTKKNEKTKKSEENGKTLNF